MRIVVVYESVFGNTHRIAEAIEQGAEQVANTLLLSVEDRAAGDVTDADVVVVGGPTHAFTLSTPSSRSEAVAWTTDPKRHLELDAGAPTTGVREYLDNGPALPRLFASFDTRAQSMRHFPGSAARGIDKQLRASGHTRLLSPASFYVSASNRLQPGEEQRAREWGQQLARACAEAASTA
jgi:hypothetical protein